MRLTPDYMIQLLKDCEKELMDMGYLVKAVHRELDDYHYFTVQGKLSEQVYVQIAPFNYGYNVSSHYRPSKKRRLWKTYSR